MSSSKKPSVRAARKPLQSVACSQPQFATIVVPTADGSTPRFTLLGSSIDDCRDLQNTLARRWSNLQASRSGFRAHNVTVLPTAKRGEGAAVRPSAGIHDWLNAQWEAIQQPANDAFTMAALIRRFINEEVSQLGSGRSNVAVLQQMLDSAYLGAVPGRWAHRLSPRPALEWLKLPFSEVRQVHFAEYAHVAMQYMSNASVALRLQLLDRVLKVAQSKWGIRTDLSTAELRRRLGRVAAKPRIDASSEQQLLFDAYMADEDGVPARHPGLVAAFAYNRTASSGQSVVSVSAPVRARANGAGVPRMQTLLKLMLDGGLRLEEVISIDWNDIDFTLRKVTLRPARAGNARTVSLSDDLMELLGRLPREERWPLCVERSALATWWRQIARRAGLSGAGMGLLTTEGRRRAKERAAG